MRVLQVINSLSTGGAEKLIIDSVPFYEERGLKVDVLCLKNVETPFWRTLRQKFSGEMVGLTKDSVYNPLLIYKLISYLKNYDLVHVHLFPALYWVVLAKFLSLSKIKIVYTEHSTNNRRRENVLLKMIDRIIYRGVSKIVTIANEVDSNIKSHLRLRDDRFTLIQNGIEISKYIGAVPLSKNMFFSDEDFLLIQVSSFRYQKDQKTLIKSLSYLPEEVKLLLVGDGQLKKECNELVDKLNLKHRVKFLGIRTDIPKLLKTVDIVILSSNYEGLSLSSIEGMASRPFIASDVPGLREIVKNYGLLFKQGDSEELANHILKLYNDREFYDRIAARCLEKAKDFDINKMVNSYIDVYTKLVSNVRN